MTKTVIRIDTFIKDRILFVQLYDQMLGIDPIAIVPFSALQKHLPSLAVFELECLIGAIAKPSNYYIPGEAMPNGKRVYLENTFPKTYQLFFEGGWDKHKQKTRESLLSFTQIVSVHPGKISGKQPFVRIRTTSGWEYVQNQAVFHSTVGIMPIDFSLLTGVFMSPVFLKKGESITR